MTLQKTAFSATLNCPQRNDAQTSWLIFKSLPIISQPILTAIAPSFLLLESSPVRLTPCCFPDRPCVFLLPCICSCCSLLLECPSHSPFVHMLSRMQDNNPHTKQELLSSKRWTQLEYKVKEDLFKVTQSLILEGSWVPKQAIEEHEPGEMYLQPGVSLQLNSSKRKA